MEILLIDGLAMAYRAFFAVKGLSAPDGQPTNALFGFIRMLGQLQNVWKPQKTVVAFDGGSPDHRLAKCPAYKAQRAPMPAELRSQLPLLNEFLAAAGIPAVRINRQEADDVLATLADRAVALGHTVRIATGDKDLMQLVCDRVRIVPPSKAEDELDEAGVKAKTGVRPDQIVDWLALIGDTADNIPGVSGIGPKTAAKLLEQFHTLEECLWHTDEIGSGSVREKMRAGAKTARLNVELMVLDRNVTGVPAWADLPEPAPDVEKLAAFLARYGIKSSHFFPGNTSPSGGKPAARPKPPQNEQMSLF